MERIQSSSKPMAKQLWPTVFDDEELPDTFSKFLRRPIAVSSVCKSAQYAPEASSPTPGLDDDSASDAETVQPIKKLRLPGGIAAAPKRIIPELDTDDRMIMTMKTAGYTNEEVAEAVAAAGGPQYAEKTIATRLGRMKRVRQTAEDAVLDEELTDWHEGEDEELMDAREAVGKKLAIYQKMLDIRVWEMTAEVLGKKINKRKYSKNACRERFEALKSGTAEPVFEQDPHPRQRRRKTLARIAARRKAKADALEAEREAEEKKAARKMTRAAKEEAARIKRENAKWKKDYAMVAKAAAAHVNDRIKAAKDKIKADKAAKRDADIQQRRDEKINVEKAKAQAVREKAAERAKVQEDAKLVKLREKHDAMEKARKAEEAELVRIETAMFHKQLVYKYMGIDPSVSQPEDKEEELGGAGTPQKGKKKTAATANGSKKRKRTSF